MNVQNGISLKVNVVSVINYALQQNKVPVVQSISVRNDSENDLSDLQLHIFSDSEAIVPHTSGVSFVPANKSFEIKNIPLTLNAEVLAATTEKFQSRLTVSLFKDEMQIAEESVEVTFLAFDEWHGYGYYPELLTAFVTPNHPALIPILSRSAELLKQWTGDPSLDAYQTQDPNRVLKQAAAIFNAIKEQNIVYSVPPASFEIVGQRVRLCDAILQQKFGTCLDLSLLYASCMEAAGLHPILILAKEHIFCGVWLEELSFPEAVQDDPSVITKRLANGVNEIAVFESTLVASEKNATFDDARTFAEHALIGTEPIEYIIDVRRARISGITPLPVRVRTEDGWHIEYDTCGETTFSDAPKAIDDAIDLNVTVSEQNNPKLIQWERKLLDLGLRNNLINLRFSKTLVPILTSSLDDLENALSDGNDFSILPKPTEQSLESTVPSFETIHDTEAYAEVIKSEFANGRLRSIFTEGELTQIMKGLYRASKTALEENGANTLYLALGLLRWYEHPKSTKPRYAPLVLLPIEIVRKSANRGFVVRLREEDPQINITVLEKIKQDFGIVVNGVDPLPLDQNGVDLRKVFTILRKAIMEQPRWDVLESAYIGIFSFSQFVMWNDLRNRTDDLLKNKIVKSLADGKLSWEASPMEIGEHVSEDDVLLPLPADASQLYAIKAACEGESFVLHGPPGTGKSQTITSLIANALAQGKSVLFVAEKMAALEVVQKRLENIGIGPFCLELHSNKSKKKDVLEQLRRASEVTKRVSAEQYAQKAERIATLRAELDKYALRLHETQPCGLNLYQLINEYEENKHAPDITAFSREYVAGLSSTEIDEHIILVERLIAAAKAANHPLGNPLSPINLTSYSQQLRTEIPENTTAYKSALTTIHNTVKDFALETGVSDVGSFADVEKLYSIAKEFDVWFSMPKSWAKTTSPILYLNDVKEMAQHFINAQNLRNTLTLTWNEAFLQQDGNLLADEYNTVSVKWFLPKLAGMSSLSKRLSVFALNPQAKIDIGTAVTTLCNYQNELKLANNLFAKYGDDLDWLYMGDHTDWAHIINLCDKAICSRNALLDITGSDEMRTLYCGEKALQKSVGALLQQFTVLCDTKDACYNLLQIEESFSQPDWIAQQISICENILSGADRIKEWISYKSISQEAINAGLGNVVDAYNNGLKHDEVLAAYKKALYHTLCIIAIDRDNSLSLFSGAVFNEKIEQLKRIDRELILLSQKEIFCRLASKVPNFVTAAAHSSELGILKRMIKSGGRGTSIRKLFEDIANLLPRLCPCMLMSPISAAQYLDSSREAFDIVVFDEASQLPTCKAVGVLARGKNAVIVGDPNQMPPTSFFATNTVDEDNLDIEDLESILDDCLALDIPQTHLLWHYRSRHESLIAFSNNKFYENRLFTFPSVNDRESKVSLVYIDGLFERGKSRRNRVEAEAVVEEIKRRCYDPQLCKQSIGVVTFNISQQHLIDDLLAEACAADSTLEKWVYESEEPIFIKNLENVQGDERDTILFSVGYGPDANGKVYMNFGPLNREGGWRRLNVAVSRARSEMMVFSALRPDQINLSRTSAEGVAALKAFLEYASGQELAVDQSFSEQYRIDTNGIVKTVCNYLKENGFDTDVSVGHSEYRIDVGVIDPNNPERYILGILLDGDCYAAAKTTRDREIAQINVLGGLGWNILRVWTMDWWDNCEKELERILCEIKNLQSNAKPPVAEEFQPVQPESEQTTDESDTFYEADQNLIPYKAAMLNSPYASSDTFTSRWYERDIINAIRLVIRHEAPISHTLLTRRVVQSFGITRAGSRIQQYLDSILDNLNLDFTLQDGEKFYWNENQSPSDYALIRVSGEDDNKRDAKDIPQAEAVNAVCWCLEHQISLSEDDLIRESAKLMGYTRMGNIVTLVFKAAILQAYTQGKIKLGQNDKWILQ